MSDDARPAARLQAVVTGDVQGVGFRAHTRREAVQRGLTGWVRNRWDGTVEVAAEGPRAALESFERFLHQGPPAAWVERVELTYADATGEFHGFQIRYE